MRPDSSTRRIPLNKGRFAVVDAADFEMLSHWKWSLVGNGYAVRFVVQSNGKQVCIYMHRMVALPDPGEQVDHINHDTLDNRRCNLRTCSGSENASNGAPNPRNTSGFRGVTWSRRKQKWVAQIHHQRRGRFLGEFHDPVAAALAYDAAAREMHGAFAVPNFPTSGDDGHG
jgi:hypothetical protein